MIHTLKIAGDDSYAQMKFETPKMSLLGIDI